MRREAASQASPIVVVSRLCIGSIIRCWDIHVGLDMLNQEVMIQRARTLPLRYVRDRRLHVTPAAGALPSRSSGRGPGGAGRGAAAPAVAGARAGGPLRALAHALARR